MGNSCPCAPIPGPRGQNEVAALDRDTLFRRHRSEPDASLGDDASPRCRQLQIYEDDSGRDSSYTEVYSSDLEQRVRSRSRRVSRAAVSPEAAPRRGVSRSNVSIVRRFLTERKEVSVWLSAVLRGGRFDGSNFLSQLADGRALIAVVNAIRSGTVPQKLVCGAVGSGDLFTHMYHVRLFNEGCASLGLKKDQLLDVDALCKGNEVAVVSTLRALANLARAVYSFSPSLVALDPARQNFSSREMRVAEEELVAITAALEAQGKQMPTDRTAGTLSLMLANRTLYDQVRCYLASQVEVVHWLRGSLNKEYNRVSDVLLRPFDLLDLANSIRRGVVEGKGAASMSIKGSTKGDDRVKTIMLFGAACTALGVPEDAVPDAGEAVGGLNDLTLTYMLRALAHQAEKAHNGISVGVLSPDETDFSITDLSAATRSLHDLILESDPRQSLKAVMRLSRLTSPPYAPAAVSAVTPRLPSFAHNPFPPLTSAALSSTPARPTSNAARIASSMLESFSSSQSVSPSLLREEDAYYSRAELDRALDRVAKSRAREITSRVTMPSVRETTAEEIRRIAREAEERARADASPSRRDGLFISPDRGSPFTYSSSRSRSPDRTYSRQRDRSSESGDRSASSRSPPSQPRRSEVHFSTNLADTREFAGDAPPSPPSPVTQRIIASSKGSTKGGTPMGSMVSGLGLAASTIAPSSPAASWTTAGTVVQQHGVGATLTSTVPFPMVPPVPGLRTMIAVPIEPGVISPAGIPSPSSIIVPARYPGHPVPMAGTPGRDPQGRVALNSPLWNLPLEDVYAGRVHTPRGARLSARPLDSPGQIPLTQHYSPVVGVPTLGVLAPMTSTPLPPPPPGPEVPSNSNTPRGEPGELPGVAADPIPQLSLGEFDQRLLASIISTAEAAERSKKGSRKGASSDVPAIKLDQLRPSESASSLLPIESPAAIVPSETLQREGIVLSALNKIASRKGDDSSKSPVERGRSSKVNADETRGDRGDRKDRDRGRDRERDRDRNDRERDRERDRNDRDRDRDRDRERERNERGDRKDRGDRNDRDADRDRERRDRERERDRDERDMRAAAAERRAASTKGEDKSTSSKNVAASPADSVKTGDTRGRDSPASMRDSPQMDRSQSRDSLPVPRPPELPHRPKSPNVHPPTRPMYHFHSGAAAGPAPPIPDRSKSYRSNSQRALASNSGRPETPPSGTPSRYSVPGSPPNAEDGLKGTRLTGSQMSGDFAPMEFIIPSPSPSPSPPPLDGPSRT